MKEKQKKDISNFFDYLREQNFSEEVCHILLRLLNYLHGEKIPKTELKKWKDLNVIGDNDKVLVDEKNLFDETTLVLFGMVWNGLIIREFDEKRQEFIYDNTKEGYEKAGEPYTLEKDIMKCIIKFGNQTPSQIADKLNRSVTMVERTLDELKGKGYAYSFSSQLHQR